MQHAGDPWLFDFRILPCYPAPDRFVQWFARSLHTCGFVVKSWDSCENCNAKRNRTKPKKIHCILVRTKESELKDFPGVNTPIDSSEESSASWHQCCCYLVLVMRICCSKTGFSWNALIHAEICCIYPWRCIRCCVDFASWKSLGTRYGLRRGLRSSRGRKKVLLIAKKKTRRTEKTEQEQKRWILQEHGHKRNENKITTKGRTLQTGREQKSLGWLGRD